MSLHYNFPNTSENTNFKHISLTGTDHCNLKLSKSIVYSFIFFFNTSENQQNNQSPKVVFWKDCVFPLIYVPRKLQGCLSRLILNKILYSHTNTKVTPNACGRYKGGGHLFAFFLYDWVLTWRECWIEAFDIYKMCIFIDWKVILGKVMNDLKNY